MADNKKSFIAYCDWKTIFDTLPNEEAGKLVKHLFAYVNDENPVSENLVTNVAFSSIKQTLKRDLIKYETIISIKSHAGRAGGIKSGEARKISKQNEANEADALKSKQNEHVTVNDNDIKDIYKEGENLSKRSLVFDFEKLQLELSTSDEWMDDVCRLYKLPWNDVNEQLQTFLTEQKSKDNLQRSFQEIKYHFVSWLKIQIEKQKKHGNNFKSIPGNGKESKSDKLRRISNITIPASP